MKQMRGLILAAVALVILSGLVYWSNKHKAAEEAKPPADAPPKILTLDEKRVDQITIQKSGAEPVVLTKLADKWEIVKPEPMPADAEAVQSLVAAAATLSLGSPGRRTSRRPRSVRSGKSRHPNYF